MLSYGQMKEWVSEETTAAQRFGVFRFDASGRQIIRVCELVNMAVSGVSKV